MRSWILANFPPADLLLKDWLILSNPNNWRHSWMSPSTTKVAYLTTLDYREFLHILELSQSDILQWLRENNLEFYLPPSKAHLVQFLDAQGLGEFVPVNFRM